MSDIASEDETLESYLPHVGWVTHEKDDELITGLYRGVFESAEQAFFWLYLRPGDVFVDCGANFGLYSAIANAAAGGNCHQVAIEADPRTFVYLKKNMASLNGTISLVNAALWDRAGTIGYMEGAAGKSAYSHVSFSESDEASLAVDAVTLDEIISKIAPPMVSLIKIDVEGAEPEVLKGGDSVIRSGRCPLIMLEFTENNLIKRDVSTVELAGQVRELGYEICRFSSDTFNLIPIQISGPIWHENLFACKNIEFVNARLSSASNKNRKISLDIISRRRACSAYSELSELQTWKEMAELYEETRAWAERNEIILEQEKKSNKELRQWAERNEQYLVREKNISAELREWVKHAEGLLAEEKQRHEFIDSLSQRIKPTK